VAVSVGLGGTPVAVGIGVPGVGVGVHVGGGIGGGVAVGAESLRTLNPGESVLSVGTAILFSLVTSLPGLGKLPIPATSKKSLSGSLTLLNISVNVSGLVTTILLGKSMCTTGYGTIAGVKPGPPAPPFAATENPDDASTGPTNPFERRSSASAVYIPATLASIRISSATKLWSTVNLTPRARAKSPPSPTPEHSSIVKSP
jgi:hypothetical protein